jgi:hypothetical protein
MSPTLFNVFIDFLARLIRAECERAGITGITVSCNIDGHLSPPPRTRAAQHQLATLMLLYADDIVLLADSVGQLQQALMIAERVFQEWGMQLSHGKTQVLCISPGPSQQNQQQDSIQLAHGSVKIVNSFKYLGSMLVPRGSLNAELSRRLSLAGAAFAQLRKFLCNQAVSLRTRMLVYKAIVVPTLLYGAAESWALTASQAHQLDVFNTSCLRRILGFTRMDHIPNEQLYSQSEQPAISTLLRCHRLRWLGHVAREAVISTTFQLLFAHSAPGYTRPRGNTSITWNNCAYQDVADLGMSGTQWFDTAQDRAVWASKIEMK